MSLPRTLPYCLLSAAPAAPEGDAKASLLVLMREWLQEKVAMADKVLVEHAVTKVYDGDVILTYAYSQVGAEAHTHVHAHAVCVGFVRAAQCYSHKT